MKKIAITQRVVIDEVTGERRDAIDQKWILLIESFKMLPLLIPNQTRYLRELLKEEQINGILLTGGNDVLLKNKKNCPLERDRIEKALLKYCIDKKIPLIGICRGMQLITHVFGGQIKKVNGHIRKRHRLIISQNSRYKNELRKLKKVNSYHNYALIKVPDNFIASAIALDGTIEAIEHRNYPIYGQMWHPEREHPFSHYQLKIIKKIFIQK